jgi:CubicO group peptidase (beta-lactamase class C family)
MSNDQRRTTNEPRITAHNLRPALARIGAFVEQRMLQAGTPGLALALTDRDGLLHAQAWGYADAAARTPMTTAHLVELGSIGKSFTAALLLQLAEQGRVDLHAPVTTYLPWFELQTRFAPITLHHLLTHTAGLYCGTEYTTEPRFEVWAAREMHAAHAPGERHHYSNLGYKLLGLVLERLLGRSYATIVGERLLEPLGMRDSVAVITHDTRRRLATPHERLYDDRPSLPNHPIVPATWVETNSADGCIAATPADAAAWLRMLLNRGAGPTGRVLSQGSFTLMTHPFVDAGRDLSYGYGMRTRHGVGYAAISHTGGMVGHYAALEGNLDDGVGVVALVNGPGAPVAVARDALNVLTAWVRGQPLPSLPPARDPFHVPNTESFAGTYNAPNGAVTVVADGDRLWLDSVDERIPLSAWGADAFVADHPRFDRFLLTFGRAGDDVVDLRHGSDVYVREGQPLPDPSGYPPEWNAFPGHYRTNNPWAPSFRVVLRRGRLLLIFAAPSDGFSEEQELLPLDGGPPGAFGVERDGYIYDRLQFDAVADGQALRAHLSTAPYYRYFTP